MAGQVTFNAPSQTQAGGPSAPYTPEQHNEADGTVNGGGLSPSVRAKPFRPAVTKTTALAVTATANVASASNLSGVPTTGPFIMCVRVAYDAPGPVFFLFGQGTSVTATAPVPGTSGDVGVDPGSTEFFSVPAGTDRVSAVCPNYTSTSPATVYFTPGV